MCTVSYLPGPDGFILTSSRDERTNRPTATITNTISSQGEEVLFPRDPQGQGSWIATSASRTACLLNGAFVFHQPSPPYRHSRGLIVLAAFDYGTIHQFADEYDFTALEPFTLILLEADELLVLRWDGTRLFRTRHDTGQPRIWSSATLYSPGIVQVRWRWFGQWLGTSSKFSPESIRTFHKTAGTGDPENALLMRRGQEYATVSLTSIVRTADGVEMIYEDLTHGHLTRHRLPNIYVPN